MCVCFFFLTDACVRDIEGVGHMDSRKCGTADIADGNVFLWSSEFHRDLKAG